MGLRQLGYVQSAPEATPGTPVTTATAKWSGLYNATWHEELTKDRPEELRGSLARYFDSRTTYKLATLDIEATASFEDIIFILLMGVKDATPVADMGMPVSAKTWTFRPLLTNVDNPKTFTLQVGDDTEGYSMEYAFARNFELGFAIGERTRLRANIVGRQLTQQAPTPSLTDRPIEASIGQNWKTYIGPAGTGLAPGDATAFAGCLINGTWRLPQSYVPHRCIDGTITYSRHQMIALSPELEVTAEFDDDINAFRAQYEADERVLVRLENTGTQIHGTSPVNKSITIDGSYQITDFGAVGGSDQDGVQTVRLMLSGEFDPDWGELFEIVVVNQVPAVPLFHAT